MTTLARLRDAGDAAYGRIALLDRASGLIATPMEFRARLRELARLPVPEIGDLCAIDLATEDGRLEGVVVSATDPTHATLLEETRRVAPIRPDSDHPVAVALRTGEAQLRGAMDDGELARYAASPEHLGLMRALAYRSAVVVPLLAPGGTIGVLSVLRLGSDSVPFGEADLSLLNDLASRAALAVGNARLFEERLAAEARLQTVLDGLAEAVIMVSAEGDLAYVNDAGARLFGFESAGELPPMTIRDVHAGYELFDEDGRALRRRAAARRGASCGARRPSRSPTGDERWTAARIAG